VQDKLRQMSREPSVDREGKASFESSGARVHREEIREWDGVGKMGKKMESACRPNARNPRGRGTASHRLKHAEPCGGGRASRGKISPFTCVTTKCNLTLASWSSRPPRGIVKLLALPPPVSNTAVSPPERSTFHPPTSNSRSLPAILPLLHSFACRPFCGVTK